MLSQKPKTLWYRWNIEAEKFKNLKEEPPFSTLRNWRRHLLFTFMQELSKNVLHDNFNSILDKIIEATQICFGFTRIRVYLVSKQDKRKLYLFKTSKNHKPPLKYFELKYKEDSDLLISRLFKSLREPLLADRASDLKLKYIDFLKIEGAYAAIPLFIEKEPFGLICADTTSISKSKKTFMPASIRQFYADLFETYALFIISIIENRKIFDQRNKRIKQLELIDELAMIIQSETESDKILRALVEHSVKLVDASGGHLKLYNERTKNLERVADYGEDVAPPDIKHKPRSIGFSNWAYKTGKILLMNDTTNHPLMKRHEEYCTKYGHDQYLNILKKRKSALIMPLKTLQGRVIGVLDLHSKHPYQFDEDDKENLSSLIGSVVIAVDKAQKMNRLQNLLKMRENILQMLNVTFGKVNSVQSVLEAVRNNLLQYKFIKDMDDVCLLIKDSYSLNVGKSAFNCRKKDQNCQHCLKNTLIIKQAMSTREIQKHGKYLALPILHRNKAIGVLYIKGKKAITPSEDEIELLNIIIGTAAIVVTTAKDYEKKIKQMKTVYEASQLSTKTRDFSEWFYPIMEKVMDIISRENRNFHLVLTEKRNDEIKLIVRETSDLYIKNKPISLKEQLLNKELPFDGSLSGQVVKEKKIRIINDVDRYKRQKRSNPLKNPYYEYDDRIKSEICIPLIIKSGIKSEEVIGVLVIDSIVPNDFQKFDLKFLETMANYLAILIYNLQLYEDRAKFQEELLRTDRRMTLTTLLNFFYHEFSKPLQEMQSTLNLINMDIEENKGISNENLQRLKEMVDEQYLIFNRFVNKYFKPFPKMESIEIRKIVNDSLIAVERTRGLDLNINGNFVESNIKTKCFPDELELGFRVIISNAIKYSKGLNKVLRYLKIEIDEDSSEELQYILVSFESRTIEQIPNDKLSLIFEPYIRGTNKEAGIGLGLALADMCIRRHMGEIKAENINHDIVKFTIKIPKI